MHTRRGGTEGPQTRRLATTPRNTQSSGSVADCSFTGFTLMRGRRETRARCPAMLSSPRRCARGCQLSKTPLGGLRHLNAFFVAPARGSTVACLISACVRCPDTGVMGHRDMAAPTDLELRNPAVTKVVCVHWVGGSLFVMGVTSNGSLIATYSMFFETIETLLY